MLKAAGVDQYRLREQLGELDHEHIDHLGRRFQRQLATVERFVDQYRFVERLLYSDGWSLPVSVDLMKRIPLDDVTLAELSAATIAENVEHLTKAEVLEALRVLSLSKDDSLRVLAACALLVSGGKLETAQRTLLKGALDSDQADLRRMAISVLCDWRAIYLPDPVIKHRELVEAIRREGVEVGGSRDAFRMMRMEFDGNLIPAGSSRQRNCSPKYSSQDDQLFVDALCTGDVDVLVAALGHQERRFAAALALIEIGELAPLGNHLERFDPECRRVLLTEIARSGLAAPALRKQFVAIAKDSDEPTRYLVLEIMLRDTALDPIEVLTLNPTDDAAIYRALHEQPNTEDQQVAIVKWLWRSGKFRMQQHGVPELAMGRLPWSCVPGFWPQAQTEQQQVDLLAIARRQQLHEFSDDLGRFLLDTSWNSASPAIVARSWSAFDDEGGRSSSIDRPRLERESIGRHFGSVGQFVERLSVLCELAEASSNSQVCAPIFDLIEKSTYPEMIDLFRSMDRPTAVVGLFERMFVFSDGPRDVREQAVRVLAAAALGCPADSDRIITFMREAAEEWIATKVDEVLADVTQASADGR